MPAQMISPERAAREWADHGWYTSAPLDGSPDAPHAGLVLSAATIILAAMPPLSSASSTAGPPSIHDEEELELPPLDGVLDDEEADDHGEPDDHDIADEPALGEEEGAGLDLDPTSELDAVDDAPAEGNEPAHEAVDIGSLADAIELPDEGPRGADERGLTREEEEEASPFDAQGIDDAGSGTGEDLAGFVDEGALPSLGVDDGAEAAPVVEASPRWDRGRYHVATGLGAEVPCGLLAVSSSYVVAVGPAVMLVRDDARMALGTGPDIDAVAVAATEDAIFVVSRRGALFASTDGGAAWMPAAAPSPEGPPIELAATPGRLWVRRRGSLSSMRYREADRPEPQVVVRKEGVRAMAVAGSALVVLSERSGELVIERLRGDDEASEAEPLPEPLQAVAAEGTPVLAAAAGGRALALLAGGAVHVSRDGGRSFRKIEAGPALAVAFAGQGESACAMALVAGERRAEDAAALVEIDPGGACTRVAEIAGAAGGPAALAWDGAREVMWVACEAGLIAFERSARH